MNEKEIHKATRKIKNLHQAIPVKVLNILFTMYF